MRDLQVMVVIAFILASIAVVPSTGAPTAKATSPSVTTTGISSPSGSPGMIKTDDAASYLVINNSQINTTTIDTVTLDAGAVVVLGTREIPRTVRINQLDAALRNTSDKRAVIDAALDQVANLTNKLQKRQITVIQAYNNGELSTQAFLRELVIISKKANQLGIYVKAIESELLLLDGGSISIGNRVNYLKHELDILTGPVRTRIQSALQGKSTAPNRYFVRTSAQGVVLATIDGDKYVREVYLAGARTAPNTTDSHNFVEVSRHIKESYPRATNISDTKTTRKYEYGLYLFKYSNFDRSIRITVDKSSGNVFHEEREITISDDNTVPGPTDKSEHYALTTRLTHPGGYMRILVTNRTNGHDLNSTISISNETIGVTGEEGGLYILQPGELTTINATINGETLSVTIGKPSQTPLPHPNPVPDSSSVFDSGSGHERWAKEEDTRS